MNKRLLLAVAFASGVLSLSAANTWYVDESKEKGTGDGKSATTAFHTIKEAIDAAADDDTISVAPGTYGEDEGKTVSTTANGLTQYARVYLTHRVKLVSTKGRDVTFITGEQSSQEKLDGSVQCVYVTAAAKGSVIEGFTLCNGGGIDYKPIAGGLSGVSYNVPGAGTYTLAYSTVSNCVGSTGGMRGGLAVGCLFCENASTNSLAIAEACRDLDAFNCIIANNLTRQCAYLDGNNTLHCTIMNNRARGYRIATESYYGARMRACVCAENASTDNPNGIAVNSVIEEAWSNETDAATVISVPKNRAGGVLVMAAPFGDFRPIAGGLLAGKADHTTLSPDWVPEAYRNRDFYGKEIASDAEIPIGALILESATPATGPSICQASAGRLSIDGHRVNAPYVSFSKDKWPSQVYLTANADTVPHLYAYRYQVGSSKEVIAPADRDGGYRYTLPRPSDGTAIHNIHTPGYVLYVDRATGSDTDNDGTSWDAPFASLAKACASCVTNARTLVYVKRGIYDNEYRSDIITSGVKARVALVSRHYASFRAVDPAGAAVTVIAGAPDPDAVASAYGCGANAIQGVDVNNATELLFSGFTFSNCFANVTNKTRSAGFHGGTTSAHVAHDCVFDHCVAYYGGVACNVHLNRCLFRNNYHFCGSSTGMFLNDIVQACVYEGNNTSIDTSRGPFGSGNKVYNVSGNLNKYTMNSSSATIYNTVMCNGYNASNPGSGYEMLGTFLWRFASEISATSGYTLADPLFVSPSGNDFRPVEGSPVLTGGSFDAADFVRYTTSDFNNQPMFATEGQSTVPSGAFAVAKKTRFFYVSPTGNDAADGLTEETARQTPAKAFELTEGRGDTVVALRGTYKTGSSLHEKAVSGSDAPAIPSRVLVPEGVRFFASAGAAETTIEGEAGVRGVFLETDATVSGFTISNCQVRVDGTNANKTDDFCGGGVLGRGYDRAFVEDCVISACTGITGCVSAYVTLNRCVALSCDNVVGSAPGLFKCSADNSYFDDIGANTVIMNFYEIVNCTLGKRNGNAGASRTQNYSIRNPESATLSKVVNLLVLQGDTTNPHKINCFARNLIFPSGVTFESLQEGALETFDLTKSKNELQALYDSTGHAVSLASLGVDGGYAGAEVDVGATDLAGNQRIQNGRVDVGCYEADWKSSYAAALGKNVTVSSASDGVRYADSTLTVPDGDSLSLTWAPGRVTSSASISYALAEGATLTVTVNGTSRTVTTGTRVDIFDLLDSGKETQTIVVSLTGGSATLGKLSRVNGLVMEIR